MNTNHDPFASCSFASCRSSSTSRGTSFSRSPSPRTARHPISERCAQPRCPKSATQVANARSERRTKTRVSGVGKGCFFVHFHPHRHPRVLQAAAEGPWQVWCARPQEGLEPKLKFLFCEGGQQFLWERNPDPPLEASVGLTGHVFVLPAGVRDADQDAELHDQLAAPGHHDGRRAVRAQGRRDGDAAAHPARHAQRPQHEQQPQQAARRPPGRRRRGVERQPGREPVHVVVSRGRHLLLLEVVFLIRSLRLVPTWRTLDSFLPIKLWPKQFTPLHPGVCFLVFGSPAAALAEGPWNCVRLCCASFTLGPPRVAQRVQGPGRQGSRNHHIFVWSP